MSHGIARDRRLRGVEWRDLVPLGPARTLWETTLSLPWLAASLTLAGAGRYGLALAASFFFFLTGLRQVHNGFHGALGLGPRATDRFLFLASLAMLGSMHAVRYNHLRHHRHCLGPEDVEGIGARMGAGRALLFGPRFPVLLHGAALASGDGTLRRWVRAELAGNAAVAGIAGAALLLGGGAWAAALACHVAAMAAAHCLTAFFAVWTVHHGCDPATELARTQRGWLKNLVSYNMFFHLEHHLFPRVPTCRLPALAARLDRALPELRRRPVY